MRLEVKTDKNRFTENISKFALLFLYAFLMMVFSKISLDLGKLSRLSEINYLCRVIMVDKSSGNFKNLSKLINQSNKQKLWDICRELTK